jgi:ketosteroid isomerase-like protein
MRRPLGIVLGAAVAAGGSAPRRAPAQAPVLGRAADTARVAREVAAVEARLDSALARRDRAALERLLADGFTWIHASDGRVDARDGWLAEATRGMALSGQRNERTKFEPTTVVYGGHTAIRSARVRLRFASPPGEGWIRQSLTFVRQADGWRVAAGQGTRMYDGPATDTALYRRYAGTYLIGPGRALVLRWDGDALLATWPSGAQVQTFLASPSEEWVAVPRAGRLRFTLGPDGRPTAVTAVRDTVVLWRAERAPRAP